MLSTLCAEVTMLEVLALLAFCEEVEGVVVLGMTFGGFC